MIILKIKLGSMKDKHDGTALYWTCISNIELGYEKNADTAKLLIDNFKDSISIVSLSKNKPAWHEYLKCHGQEKFKDLFVPLLLNRDKSKDPHGLTPLHLAYLLRNQYRGEIVLDYLLSIPELVELDGLQGDKFHTLPHQVTPLPKERTRSYADYFFNVTQL